MRKPVPTLLASSILLIVCAISGFAATAAPPTVTQLKYGGSVDVLMSTSTTGATIRYTTNGQDPTTNSTAYTKQMTFTESTVLKARTFKSGLTQSAVVTANITVYQVSQVVFEPWHSPLDNNPNTGGGWRIFAESQYPGDPVVREAVFVTVTITPAAPGVWVYVKVLDPDDPSSNTAPLDPNGPAGSDNFPDGTGRAVQGALNSGGALTDSTGRAQFGLTLSRQPGNNFVVTATTDPFYVTQFRVRASDGSVIEDLNGNALPNARAKRTQMLTVWRRVHVEVDRMSNVTGNTTTGSIASVIPNTPRRGQTTLGLGLNLPAPGALGTDGLLNRFEGGTIAVPINGVNTVYSVVSNTANVSGPDQVVVQGLVPANAVSQRYMLVDDDAAHGFPDGAVIPLPDTGRLVTCFASAYILPVFDLPNPRPVVPFFLNTPGNNAGDLLPLYRFDNMNSQGSMGYWTIYILSALQGTTLEDGDPKDANGDGLLDESAGISGGTVDALGGVGAIVFLESINELFAGGVRQSSNSKGQGEQDMVVHQVGHLFGAEHIDGGLMGQTSNVFSATSLSKVRRAWHP